VQAALPRRPYNSRGQPFNIRVTFEWLIPPSLLRVAVTMTVTPSNAGCTVTVARPRGLPASPAAGSRCRDHHDVADRSRRRTAALRRAQSPRAGSGGITMAAAATVAQAPSRIEERRQRGTELGRQCPAGGMAVTGGRRPPGR
jgi:hypothetical protein